ncbi:ribonuclease H-like domain-containing protein [Tanacetum coccineum]
MVGGDPSSPTVLINNIDAGNPLHIQANDNSSTILIPFKLRGTKNYRIRASAMKLALQARNKHSFVDGTFLKNAYNTSDVLSAQWDKCNAIVLTWIMNYVSQDVYMGLVYSENVVVVWKELENTYVDYYHSLDSLLREFDALTKLPKYVCDVKCSCVASKELSLHQQLIELMQFLMGLDDCYQPVRSALLTRDPLPAVKDAYTTVSREESHRGIPETSSATELKMSDTSFAAKSVNNSRRVYNNNNNSTKGFNNNNMNRGPNPKLVCKNYGANQHLTISTVRMFDVVNITSLKITAGHPNGTLATISHVGNLKLSNNVLLYDILVVPSYCVSLSFVNKLIRDSKMYVGFDEDKCYIQDLKKEKVLGIGSESGGLYLFDMDKVNFVGKSNMVPCFSVSKPLSHNRLGHPSDQVLSVLQSDLNITKNYFVPVCEVCHRAKQTRDTFTLSDHKSKGLVKAKDDVLDVFVSFINLISNQFNVKIKTVRSDTGTEFVNKRMHTLFSDLGIIHQTSCAHTPQQNGIAERKHRYLLNVTRSLMLREEFLSDFGLIAIYLVNRLPSSVLNGKASSVVDGSGLSSQFDTADTAHNMYQEESVAATQLMITTYMRTITPGPRRSSKQSKLLVKLNDYVVNSSVRYGIEKFVCYYMLSESNLCFATNLNESIEPSCYEDVMCHINWLDAMNSKIKDLNSYSTWIVYDLPASRKPIDYSSTLSSFLRLSKVAFKVDLKISKAMQGVSRIRVMAAPVISVSSYSSDESVGSSILRVILIGYIPIEVPVASEVGAAAVASPAWILELDTHSSLESGPSEGSQPPIPVAPMVLPFLCSDDSESDIELSERHVS